MKTHECPSCYCIQNNKFLEKKYDEVHISQSQQNMCNKGMGAFGLVQDSESYVKFLQKMINFSIESNFYNQFSYPFGHDPEEKLWK